MPARFSRESAASRSRGQLARVVRMDHDIDRLFRAERLDKRCGDPAGIDHRNARMKADDAEMRDLVERTHDFTDAPRRKQKRDRRR